MARYSCAVVCVENAYDINYIIANPYLNYRNAYNPFQKFVRKLLKGKVIKEKGITRFDFLFMVYPGDVMAPTSFSVAIVRMQLQIYAQKKCA